MPVNIPIAETWDRTSWINWSTLQSSTQTFVSGQNHIDLATFLENGWSGPGTFGHIASLNNFPGATISATGAESITLTCQLAQPVDISAFNVSGSMLTLALPNFPLADVTLSSCFIDLSDNNFTTLISLPFSSSLNTVGSGNTSVSFSTASIASAIGTQISSVRIRIATTATCTIYLLALRILGPAWLETNVDYDDSNLVLRQSVPLDGDPSFVVPSAQVMPILYRTDNPSGATDPMPINGTIGFTINTGSASKANQFTLYTRVTSSSYQAFQLSWGSTTQVNLFTSSDVTHTSTPTLSSHQTYLVLCTLDDTTFSLSIYPVNANGLLGSQVFTTGLITDTAFIRQPGRIGFQATLLDGDAYVQSIRPSGLTFATFKSAPLVSRTPVIGTRLYANYSPSVQLWESWDALADENGREPILLADSNRSLTGASTSAIINNPSYSLPTQGIISNSLSPVGDSSSGITDFANLSIQFSIWVANRISHTLDNLPAFSAALINSAGASIPLTLPPIIGGNWQAIKVSLPDIQFVPGLYKLAIYYNGTSAVRFWIDGVSVSQRSIAWFARSISADAEGETIGSWVPFNDLVNSDANGIRFPYVGNQIQIRGDARQQSGSIYGSIYTLPQYAQLGKLVFPDGSISGLAPIYGAIAYG